MFEPPVLVNLGLLTATAAATQLLCFLLSPLARRWGWMDLPEGRKVHAAPTPLVGGAAVLLAVAAVAPFLGLLDIPLLAACALAFACGLVDDRRSLQPLTRFIWQTGACLLMIFLGKVALTDFGRLFWDGTLQLGILAVPVTVFAALGVINAFNMIDGVDGLGGSVFLVCAASMAWLAIQAGQFSQAQLLLLACAAVGGFLCLNARFPWNPGARVFLGDSGTNGLGLLLAWMFIDLGNGADRAFAPMTAVWIIGLPLLDTTRLIGRRWLSGRSALSADQQHLHHAFLRAGFSVRCTWLSIATGSALFALAGIAMERCGLAEYLRFYLYVGCGIAYLLWMEGAWRKGRFLGRNIV